MGGNTAVVVVATCTPLTKIVSAALAPCATLPEYTRAICAQVDCASPVGVPPPADVKVRVPAPPEVCGHCWYVMSAPPLGLQFALVVTYSSLCPKNVELQLPPEPPAGGVTDPPVPVAPPKARSGTAACEAAASMRALKMKVIGAYRPPPFKRASLYVKKTLEATTPGSVGLCGVSWTYALEVPSNRSAPAAAL